MAKNNARDERQSAVIEAVLGKLPQDHPAREAYAGGADTIQLMSLVEREDLADQLNQAWLDWYSRRLRQGGRQAA